MVPPPQGPLEADDKRALMAHFGIRFNQLCALTNMPVHRFFGTVVSQGCFAGDMQLLRGSHRAENLETVVCRSLLSVDWQGALHDGEFNQMPGLPATRPPARGRCALGRAGAGGRHQRARRPAASANGLAGRAGAHALRV